jgi:hypothetical protein
LLVVVDGLLITALLPMDEPEVGQCEGFDGPVTGLAADHEGLLVVLGGLPVAALLPTDDPKAVQREGFTEPESISRQIVRTCW